MRSCLFTGRVTHVRLGPVRHRFVYPACFVGLDLAELPALRQLTPLFAYNAAGLLAVHDGDYLGAGKQNVHDKLSSFLSASGFAERVEHVELITVARCLAYAYNPVNFYGCYAGDGRMVCAVAEINNTYGETHLYLLDEPIPAGSGYQAAFRVKKEFFVSPFFDLRGEYVFRFARTEETIRIQVELWREGALALWARLGGRGVPLTRGNVLRALVRFPLDAALTMPRIVRQALCLKRKGLKPLLKPVPTSPRTIRTTTPRRLAVAW